MKKKKRAVKLLGEAAGIELPCSSVTINYGSEVTLCDCERIMVYEHDEIVIRLRDLTVGIYGSSLELDTYMTDRAIVRGTVDSVKFLRERFENEAD